MLLATTDHKVLFDTRVMGADNGCWIISQQAYSLIKQQYDWHLCVLHTSKEYIYWVMWPPYEADLVAFSTSIHKVEFLLTK